VLFLCLLDCDEYPESDDFLCFLDSDSDEDPVEWDDFLCFLGGDNDKDSESDDMIAVRCKGTRRLTRNSPSVVGDLWPRLPDRAVAVSGPLAQDHWAMRTDMIP